MVQKTTSKWFAFLQTLVISCSPVTRQSTVYFSNPFELHAMHCCLIAILGLPMLNFKLKLAAAGYKAIKPPVIEKSFVTSRFWPVDYRFVSAVQNKQKGRSTPVDTFCGHSPRSDAFGLQQLHQMKRREADIWLSDAFGRFLTTFFHRREHFLNFPCLTTSKYFTNTVLRELCGPTRTQTASPLPN